MYPLIFSAGASPCPTLWDIIFYSVRSTCFFSLFTLNFSLFSARQLQGLFLRYVVVCTVSLATAFGCLSLAMQLLLFRKNHARLACSVVNALTTAHCRYQLLRIADRGNPPPYTIGYIIQFVLPPHL